jgi:hypothetical protein
LTATAAGAAGGFAEATASHGLNYVVRGEFDVIEYGREASTKALTGGLFARWGGAAPGPTFGTGGISVNNFYNDFGFDATMDWISDSGMSLNLGAFSSFATGTFQNLANDGLIDGSKWTSGILDGWASDWWFDAGAAGGYVLYPSKVNSNFAHKVYSKN